MARSYRNIVVAMVTALGLGAGMGWILFAQAPDATPERFVTVDVGNEKVRCKILRSWPLPSGGRAYQVKGVESGDMLTLVRDNTAGPAKDAPVRVYRWRDAETSPTGAPVPPAIATTSATSAASPALVESKSSHAHSNPQVVLNGAKRANVVVPVAPPKTTKFVTANGRERFQAPQSLPPAAVVLNPMTSATPKETIIVVSDSVGPEAKGPLAHAAPLKPAEKRAKPGALPPTELVSANTIDSLGQAPWAKDDAALHLPGKITMDLPPEHAEGRAQMAPAPKGDENAAAKVEPVIQTAAVEPQSLPELPLPRSLPALEASTNPPTMLPAIQNDAANAPTVAPPALPSPLPPPLPTPLPTPTPLPSPLPPPLPLPPAAQILPPTAQTVAPTVPASADKIVPVSPAPSLESPPATTPPRDEAKSSVYDRLFGPSAAPPVLPAPPVAAPPTAVGPPPMVMQTIDVPSSDRTKTTEVFAPMVEQSSAAPMKTDFAVSRPKSAQAAIVVDDPIAPPTAPPAMARQTPAEKPQPPAPPREVIVDIPYAAEAGPAPFGMNTKTYTPPTPTKIANVAEPKTVRQFPRDGSFNRTLTSIPVSQAVAVNHAETTRPANTYEVAAPIGAAPVSAASIGVAPGKVVYGDSTPVVTKRAASRPTSIVGLMGGYREDRPAWTQPTLTGRLFGDNVSSRSSQVVMTNSTAMPMPAKETIVEVTDRQGAMAHPVVMKKTSEARRPATIVDIVGGHRDGHATTSAVPMAAPVYAPQQPAAVTVDRTRVAPLPAAVKSPISTETLIEMPSGTRVIAEGPPVVQRKPSAGANRSSIVSLMGDRPATTSTFVSGSAYAAPHVAPSFDRTRTSMTPNQMAALREAAQPAVSGATVSSATIHEWNNGQSTIVETAPVMQKRAANGNRSRTIVSMLGTQPASSPVWVDREAPARPGHASAPAAATASRPAFAGAAPSRTLIPVNMPGMAQPVDVIQPIAYGVPPQANDSQPTTNPIQQASHTVPTGKFTMNVPANPAMDRPVTAVVAGNGDRAALAKLMQTAQDSPHPSQRELAVLGLSSYDGRSRPQLVNFLNQLAVSDPAAAVRAAAVNALARMNVAPEMVSATLDTLRDDADVRVRQAVTDAVSAFGLDNR